MDRPTTVHAGILLPYIMFTLILFTLTPAFGQTPESDESVWTQSRLTGDWGGLRTQLNQKGITIDAEYTAFYQGLASGSESGDYDYSGRTDVFLNLNTTKLGWWKGGLIKAHLEYNHGDVGPYLGGGIMAANTALYFPAGNPNEAEITSIYLIQQLSDTARLTIGKINGPDLAAGSDFYGGWGIHRFMNMGFVTPPTGVPPANRFGALATFRASDIDWSVFVYDTDDRTDDYWLNDLFENGVVASVSAKKTMKLYERATSLTLAGIYSTKEGTDLSFAGLPSNLETTKKNGYYNLSLTVQHNLQEKMDNPKNAWGVHLKASITDGNPNPIQNSFIAGIGGNPLFFNRPLDHFGIGFFYYSFSNELRDSLDSTLDFDNELGVEAFYSYAVTPWLHLTGDLQYIDPGRGGRKRSTIAGTRLNIKF